MIEPTASASPSRAGEPADRPGLYVHVPFCSAICPYCDFAVTTGKAERRSRFLAHLVSEARLDAGRRFAAGASFDTVYLGGGTPSALLAAQLEELLAALRRHLPVLPAAWLTLEANPEDVDAAALAAWRALGVGTLSLGVQSFDDGALRFLGRRHDAAGARRAVELALAAGFPVVSVDLIYGLPAQTPEAWGRDLAVAAALAPQHLSCYQLTIHPRTAFGRRQALGEAMAPPEPAQAELFALTHHELAARGYSAYEVSSFARAPEHRSRHNRKYWRHAPYLGLGPSAHSFDGASRWWNHRSLATWQRAVASGAGPVAGREAIGPGERALEHLLLGLRSDEGVDLALLRRLGLDLGEQPLVHRLVAEALLVREPGRLRATLAGWAVADGLAAALAGAGEAARGRRPAARAVPWGD